MSAAELAQRVVGDLAEDRLLIFIGAGASLGNDAERAASKGAPSSGDLMRSIADRFGLPLTETSTLKGVASLAARGHGDSSVKGHVAEAVRSGCTEPLRAHKALARLSPTTVVTTNYDRLYEMALDEIGRPFTRLVRPVDIPQADGRKPVVVKLHGDLELLDTIVLTSQDYRRWQEKATSLITHVLADLQRYVVVFVGYSLKDENLERLLGVVEARLGSFAPKRYALVRSIDPEVQAGWGDLVEFVEGDATAFLETLADLREERGSGPGGGLPSATPPNADPSAGLQRLREQIHDGDLDGALESCDALEQELRAVGALNTAATNWLLLAGAAEQAENVGASTLAFVRAGTLFLEARTATRAEAALGRAQELTRATETPRPVVEEIERLLLEARMYSGDYSRALQDIDAELEARGAGSSPQLLHALRNRRSQINEALGDTDAALRDLGEALRVSGQEALFDRIATRAAIARILWERYEWGDAHHELNLAVADVAAGVGDEGGALAERCLALIGLVRGNVHQALGEDAFAIEFYRDSLRVFEKLGETALAVSALQGFISTGLLLGYGATDETQARLIDYARTSVEHQYVVRKEGEAVENLAVDNLVQAQRELAQALTAANALHSSRTARRIANWQGEVLLKAGAGVNALSQFVTAGNRKKAEEVASALARTAAPVRHEDFNAAVTGLTAIAATGDLPSRGAAFAALRSLADVLPEDTVSHLVDLLASVDELPSSLIADRNLLSGAAALAHEVLPLTDGEGASRVGRALVRAVVRRDCFWTSYKESCAALAVLAGAHPESAAVLEVPLERLVELVEGDVINDRHEAMFALVNFALAGSAGAREVALGVLSGGNTLWHVSWRHLLGDVDQEEIAATIRSILPHSVSGVEEIEGGVGVGFGGISPAFLRDWDLPEAVRDEVSEAFSAAVADPLAILPDRQAAALMLGTKADQLGERGRSLAIEALMRLLAEPVEAHSAVRSLDHPLSPIRTNIGQPVDVKAAAAFSLLRLSRWMSDELRRVLLGEIERLTAGQVDALGRSVAGGLRHFSPRSSDERSWLATRLLLLMNAPDPTTRRNAAQSLGALVERGMLPYNAELSGTTRFLAERNSVVERAGAAYALSRMSRSEHWDRGGVNETLDRLRTDASFTVRSSMDPEV